MDISSKYKCQCSRKWHLSLAEVCATQSWYYHKNEQHKDRQYISMVSKLVVLTMF